MKKIITLLVLVVTITLGACSDFLDARAYDFVSPEEFYQNENDVQMALAGVYSALATKEVYGNMYSCMISNVDDLSFYARAATQTVTRVFGNGHNTSDSDIYNAWTAIYKGIESANILLERIEGADINESVKTRIKGEAKFLRAYYHFLLVQAWKDVPIRKESFKDVSKSALPATPMAEALDWVIEEMEEALPMVDNKMYDKRPSYVKKTVVEGVLARVALTRAGYPTNGGKPFYEMAARYAKSVKDSNKHGLNPDVYEMWKCMASDRYDTEYNESMWEVEFTGSRIDGTHTDGRIGNVIGNVQRNGSPEGLGYSYWFYSGSLILWDLYDNNDKRRDLSMAPYWINANDQYVNWGANQIVQRACGKFRREWESITPKNKNWTQINYPLIRYADVLLMLAEAENEANQGPTALAYEAVNIVRERAGIEPLSGLSYAGFQQEIRNERGRELCFESLRKYDLVRWGIYTEAIAALGEATYDSRWPAGGNYSTARAFAERTQKKHEFLPIPLGELSINTELTQNPLW
jgi:hypothetical protein